MSLSLFLLDFNIFPADHADHTVIGQTKEEFFEASAKNKAKGARFQQCLNANKGVYTFEQNMLVLEQSVQIGRLTDNTSAHVLPLNLDGLSREHCKIVKQFFRWKIEDTNSTNGSAIERKGKVIPLEPGKPITLEKKDIIILARKKAFQIV